MKTIICYQLEGKEHIASMAAMPVNCGKCNYLASKRTYSHYDDLDGWDVYHDVLRCTANGMKISSFISEGSLDYDYGVKAEVLGKRDEDCLLYEKQVEGTLTGSACDIGQHDWVSVRRCRRCGEEEEI